MSVLLVGCCLFQASGFLAPPPDKSRLAVIMPMPVFELVNQDGRRFRSDEVQGKVLLVSFIFTTCSGTCPATTHRLAQIQEELKNRNRLGSGSVHLLTITLDPVRDTPPVLRGYMRLYDVDSPSWTFLTGSPEVVAALLKKWGMWARPAAQGQLDHPSRVYLVDRKSKVREIYDLTFLKPRWVADDIDLLLQEGQPTGR